MTTTDVPAAPDIPMPERVARLPRDARGYPVPYFVAYVNGVPDFRVADGEKKARCVERDLCWICGDKLGRFRAFLIGPMCAVNRISADPPMHRDCAEYSAKACPFLTRPQQKRNPKDLPEGHQEPGGVMIRRNPGVALVWVVERGNAWARMDGGEILFRLGQATEALWYREARPATRAEVEASIQTGLPLLQKLAQEEGPDAVEMLEMALQAAKKYLPEA